MNFWFRDMKTYLIWKRDSNAEGRQSSIHIRQVDPDGISFKDDWKEVTLVTANLTTERRVIEGPWMIYRYLIYTESSNTTLICKYLFSNTWITKYYLHRKPYYYLFYAGDGIDTEHYHIGVARSFDIKGPFEKFGRQILHLDEDTYDAGKNCTFVGPGNNYAAFMVSRNTFLIQL